MIDHANRIARYGNAVLKDGDQILSKRRVVQVVVEKSNSAFYDCVVATTTTSTPEVDATLGFMKALGPYLIEAAVARGARLNALIRQKTPADTAEPRNEQADRVEAELSKINAILFEPLGLRALFARTTAELDGMRRLKPGDSLYLKPYQDFVKPACLPDGDCKRLRAIEPLTVAIDALGKIYGPFARAVKEKPNASNRETLLVELGGAALGDADGLLALAYLVERLVLRTFAATTTFPCPQTITMSRFSGRDATITVSSTSISEISRVSSAEPYALKVNVRPDWPWRPTLGLAFIAVPDGKHPKFVTKAQNDTMHLIRKAGFTDDRYSYGLVLASTWRFLDWRDSRSHLAFYIPELTVNPSENTRSVAVGVGVSWYRLKVGIGRAWIKHSVLADSLREGIILRDPEELSTRDAYGGGKFYWSVSLVGLPPFLPE